jgi:hypothetical protein
MKLSLTPPRRRRLTLVLVTAALLAVAAIVGIASATTDRASTSRASLRMVRLNPVTITGHGFKAHRRVDVRLATGHTISRSPLANRSGSFTVQFPTVVDRCSGFTVTASQQSRPTAVLRVPPKPACAPAMAS